ncbi:hypothetical protein Vretifemale_4958, partial [Volvox reticuliferus]
SAAAAAAGRWNLSHLLAGDGAIRLPNKAEEVRTLRLSASVQARIDERVAVELCQGGCEKIRLEALPNPVMYKYIRGQDEAHGGKKAGLYLWGSVRASLHGYVL